MGWYSIGCVFDTEPEWARLEALHPHAWLRGYRHRNGKLWLLDANIGTLPADHPPFISDWPERFALPDAVTLSDGLRTFVEQAGAVGQIVMTFGPNILHYGAAVATLTGQRVYVFGGSDEDFDMAFVVDPDGVASFGAEGGLMDITWTDGAIHVQCMHDPEDLDEAWRAGRLDQLEALPFVTLNRESKPLDNTFYRWSTRIWPPEWGDPATVLGLGTWEFTAVWEENLEHCHYRPGRDVAKPDPSLLGLLWKLWFKRGR